MNSVTAVTRQTTASHIRARRAEIRVVTGIVASSTAAAVSRGQMMVLIRGLAATERGVGEQEQGYAAVHPVPAAVVSGSPRRYAASSPTKGTCFRPSASRMTPVIIGRWR